MNQTTKTIKWIVGIIIVVVIAVGYFLATKAPKETRLIKTRPIKIGYFGPMTGPVGAAVGESIFEAFQLVHEQSVNAGTYSIDVIYEDDKCDPKTAVSAAQKLLNIDKVDVLISGLCSRSTIAVAPLAEERNIILISAGAAAPSITNAGDYIFRVSASSVLSGSQAATMLTNQGFHKVAVLFETEEYATGWKDAFSKSFQSTPGNQVVEEGVPVASKDVRTQLLKLSQEKPDAYLFIALTSTMANVALKQSKELDIKEQIIGNETFSLRAVRENNPNAEGILVVQYVFDTKSPKFSLFEKQYKSRYGRNIKEGVYAAFAADVYSILNKAIEECGRDNRCIKNFLYDVQNYDGLSGRFSIDRNGDTERKFEIKYIKMVSW